MNKIMLFFIFALGGCIAAAQSKKRNDTNTVKIEISTIQGHAIMPGSSGFNVRIGDKVWSYKHPDFIKAVNELRPGWLRYWSGTAGDAFSAATGMYDKEYINMFDKGEAYDRLYQFVEVKGPHRIIDLYHLLGTVNAKLVVTVNAFTETPEMTLELARFCKNNNIKVEVWQFCNEPYFYIPGRQRYWWNDGYDYAQKMKPHAEAIQQIFPDAKLALNFTWDGIWGFMKEINSYQKEKGAFWNVFSKHSYAPHTGKVETFEEAYRRMNTKLIEATDEKAMNEIEEWTKKDIPMLITEFGVWNRPLNGIMSAVYNAEYTLRQLSHPNTWLIGSHEISNKIKPAKNLNKQITDAYETNISINATKLETGIEWDDEGKALRIVHEATNNSNYVWGTTVTGAANVPGLNNKEVVGMYALAMKGTNGYDYLLVTNRSGEWHNVQLMIDGISVNKAVERMYIAEKKADHKNVTVQTDKIQVNGTALIMPYSLVLLKWKNNRKQLPEASRIYKAEIKRNGIALQWWKQPLAISYLLTMTDKKTGKKTVRQLTTANYLCKGLIKGHSYEFTVQSQNNNGVSAISEPIAIDYQTPDAPEIFKTAPRDNQITVFWKSVSNATGYKVTVSQPGGIGTIVYDAGNVFGFKIKALTYDIPCNISVKAYNGLDESAASTGVVVTCKRNIPLPPSNISAIENDNGAIVLKWSEPKQMVPGIQYRLYRGEHLHQFSLLKEGITVTDFTDVTAEKGKDYYYTVKSYTADGECSFYPNIATIIRTNKKTSVTIESIVKRSDGYEIKAKYSNLPVDGETVFAVLISDVSYLNGEEIKYTSADAVGGMFVVKIPLSALKSNTTYSVRASVQTNGGTPVVSLPPHKEFKVE